MEVMPLLVKVSRMFRGTVISAGRIKPVHERGRALQCILKSRFVFDMPLNREVLRGNGRGSN